MFKLELTPRTELQSYNNHVGRMYITPAGEFPSVTTVLGQHYGNDHIEAWKERIGREQAEKESEIASRNGTELHNVFEKHLLNQSYKDEHSIARMRFESVKRKLDSNIKTVYGVEFPLFSKNLKTAGRADGIVNWNGENAIIDLKTTKKYKREEWIESYFTQASAYGIMYNEGYPDFIKKIIIIFSTSDFECYYFEKNIQEYSNLVNTIFKENR